MLSIFTIWNCRVRNGGY